MARTFDKELDRSERVIKLKLHQLCQDYGEQDVAEWSRTSVYMMQKYRNPNEAKYNLPAANLRLLSKQISTLHDATIIKDYTDSSQCVLLSPPGVSNGEISDDMKELIKSAGEAACCYDAGDKKGLDEAISDLMKAVKNMNAEGERL